MYSVMSLTVIALLVALFPHFFLKLFLSFTLI